MKTFFKACALFSLLIITYCGRAQQRETPSQLFNVVENKIRYRNAELEKIFTKIEESKYQNNCERHTRAGFHSININNHRDNIYVMQIMKEG